MRTAVVAPAVALLRSVASSVTVPALHAVEHVVREMQMVGEGESRRQSTQMHSAVLWLQLRTVLT